MGRTLTFDDIFALREASSPALRADGTVAFVVTTADREADENRSAIWMVAAGSEPTQLTHGEHDSAPQWSPDGRHLSFIRKDAGKPQIWLLPSGGGEARTLTSFASGARDAMWSPDSSKLAVTAIVDIDGEPEDDADKERRATAPIVVTTAAYKGDGAGLYKGLRSHLFVVDVETGEATPLSKGDVTVSAHVWSPDSKHILFTQLNEDRDITGRSHLLRIAADGGTAEEIARWDGIASVPIASSDSKRTTFAGSTHLGPGHTRIFTVDAKGGTPTALAPDFDRNVMLGGPAYPGAEPTYDSNGTLLFAARDRGCTHLYAGEEHPKKIVGGDDRVVSGASVCGTRVAYVISAPGIPADVYIANTDGSNEQRLTELSKDALDGVDLHRPEPRTFTAPDGTPLHGWTIGAQDGVRKPLLVDVHGGPHNAWSPAFDTIHVYHQTLVDAGWAILMLNPRGSDGYGEDFFTGVVGGWGLYDEQDFLAAVDALIEDGVADPKRLAVCGYSYGGYMTNWLTARTDRFKVAVSGGTVSDLQSMYGTSDLGYWMGAFEHGGELHEARDAFAASSPLSYVENVTAPTLILHGGSDDRCPVGQAEQWFISLRRMQREVEFVRYPGASHLFILNGRPSHRIDYNERIVDWLTSHI